MRALVLIASFLIAANAVAFPLGKAGEAARAFEAEHARTSEAAGCRPGYFIEGDEDSPDCVKTILLDALPCDDMMADALNLERQVPASAHVIRIAFPMPEGDAYTIDVYLDTILGEMDLWDFCSEDMGFVDGVSPDDEDFHSGRDDCGP